MLCMQIQIQGLAIADAVTAIGSVCTSIGSPSAIDAPSAITVAYYTPQVTTVV